MRMQAHRTSESEPLWRSRRFAMIAVVAAAALTLGAIGAFTIGAAFTASSSVGGQSVTTATVEIDASTASNSTPINATQLLPGDSVSSIVNVSNTGTTDLYYTITATPDEDHNTALSNVLSVQITVGSITETRTLSSWSAGVLQIATPLPAGATDKAEIHVSLPSGASNSLQGRTSGFSIDIAAIQARNTTAPNAGWSPR